MNDRIDSLDIAKGLTICMVVLLHLPKVGELTYFNIWGGEIQTVYMPIFFAISGILHRSHPISTILSRLLIPYLTFYILAVFVELGKDIIKGIDIDWQFFLRPFMGETTVYPNTAIWFLLALTVIKVITQYIDKIKSLRNALLISVVLSITGYILGKHFGAYPYYISVALLCQIFYFAGFKFKGYIVSKISLLESISLILMLIALYMLNPAGCNVSMNHIPMEYCTFIILSLVAVRLFIGLCDKVACCKPLSKINAVLKFYGINSLVVFGTHLMLIGITPVVGKIVDIPDIYIPVTMIAIMIMEIPIIFLFNNYGKFLLGK